MHYPFDFEMNEKLPKETENFIDDKKAYDEYIENYLNSNDFEEENNILNFIEFLAMRNNKRIG